MIAVLRFCALLLLCVAGAWTTDHVLPSTLLQAESPSANGHYGSTVAINAEATRLVVGTPDTAAGHIDIYERVTGAWQHAASFSGTAIGDRFGAAVAIAGSCVLVGAPLADHAGATDSGHAVLFQRAADGSWSHVTTLGESGGAVAHHHFGAAVALEMHTTTATYWAAIGAPGASRMDANEQLHEQAGRAYRYLGTTGDPSPAPWTATELVPTSPALTGAHFGAAVAISADGRFCLIGAPDASSGGQALMFEQVDTALPEIAAFSFGISNDAYGASVALDAAPDANALWQYQALIGAPGFNGAIGMVICQRYDRGDQTWLAEGFIQAPTAQNGARFGAAVARRGAQALVGAPGYTHPVITPDTILPEATDALAGGIAHLFTGSGGTWVHNDSFWYDDENPRVDADAGIGNSLALTEYTRLLGAPRFDQAGFGNSGAALFYDTDTRAPPTLHWPSPAPIVYGTALDQAQLNASSPISGSFLYQPAAGSVLASGSQELRCTFTPSDTTTYRPVSARVTLSVTQAASTVTWATPDAIVYGTPLDEIQLNASGSGAGSLTYTPPAGSVLAVGQHSLNVVFTPNDTNYAPSTASVELRVSPAAPTITWPQAAPISYGTALTTLQLNASSPASGSFRYEPSIGSVLAAGSQRLRCFFTSSDPNYRDAEARMTLTVEPAIPRLSWPTPAAIDTGTPLSSAQLNASAEIAGTFAYDPPAGTVLAAGQHQLSATFTPTDRANYQSASLTTPLLVQPTVTLPILAFTHQAAVVYEGIATTRMLRLDQAAPEQVTLDLVYEPALAAAPTLTIAAGARSVAVPILIPQDDLPEASPQQVLLRLSQVQGATIGAQDHLRIELRDDDFVSEGLGIVDEDGNPVTSDTRFLVGMSLTLRIHDGQPPYRISATNMGWQPLGPATGVVDHDGDSDTDPGQLLVVMPLAAGAGSLTVRDAADTSLSLALTVEALPSRDLIDEPELPISAPHRTRYGAIAGGTPDTIAQLLALSAARDTRRLRAGAWDEHSCSFIELPEQPSGGLLPVTGLYLASRFDTELSLDGTPVPAPVLYRLVPGWNFIGIPNLADGRESLPLSALRFRDEIGHAIAAEDRDQLIEQPFWWWNGSSFDRQEQLEAGLAYWIYNASDEPAQTLFMEIPTLDASAAGWRIRSQGYASRPSHLPPPAPTPFADDEQLSRTIDSGGCSSGIGVIMLALIGLLFGLPLVAPRRA